MKIKHLFILSVFSLLNFQAKSQSASHYVQNDSVFVGMGCSQGWSLDYKFKPLHAKTYGNIVSELSSGSFGREDFGSDSLAVYYKGQILPKLNPKNTGFFVQKNYKELLDSRFLSSYGCILTDGVSIYYKNQLVKNAKLNDLKWIITKSWAQEGLYFTSNKQVYFAGIALPKFSIDDKITYFTVQDANDIHKKINYASNNKVVYCDGIEVKGADVATFQTKNTPGYSKYFKKQITAADKNSYYAKAEKLPVEYTELQNIPLFADSLLNENTVFTFTVSDKINKNQSITFYLKGKKLLKKNNIKLHRINKLVPSEKVETRGKGREFYDIRFYENKKQQIRAYYEHKSQEFDIQNISQLYTKGDGWEMDKKAFEKLVKNSKPVIYKEDSAANVKEWREKINAYLQDKKVLSVDSSFSFQTYPNNPKRHKTTLYTDSDQDGKKFFTGGYEGNITYKFPFSEYHTEDNYYSKAGSDNLMRVLEKKYPNEKLAISSGYLEEMTESGNKYYFFTLYCSEDLAKKIPEKYIKTPFLKHYYYIDLQME